MQNSAIIAVLAIAGAVWFFSKQEKASPNSNARGADLFADGRFGDGFPFND